MIYQIFVFTKAGKNLISWSKKGFPDKMKLKDNEMIEEERIREITTNIAPTGEGKESFNSIDFERLTASFYFTGKIAYAILSDKNDPLKARKKTLKDISEKMKSHIVDLQEGKTLENLNKFMQRKIADHTRLLANFRGGIGGSTILGFLGGLIFLSAFSFVGRLLESQIAPNNEGSPLLWLIGKLSPLARKIHDIFLWIPESWLIYILFFLTVAVITGIVVGSAAGKKSGGFIGCYIIMMLSFSIPAIFSTWPSLATESVTNFLLRYYSIVSPISVFYSKFSEAGVTPLWQILLILGISFSFLSALVSTGIGHFFGTRNLLGSQIPKKPSKKKLKRKKEERSTEEKAESKDLVPEDDKTEEEDMEIGEKELEELEELFGEK